MMLTVGLIAVICWDSIFPDRRDVMVLSPLPRAAAHHPLRQGGRHRRSCGPCRSGLEFCDGLRAFVAAGRPLAFLSDPRRIFFRHDRRQPFPLRHSSHPAGIHGASAPPPALSPSFRTSANGGLRPVHQCLFSGAVLHVPVGIRSVRKPPHARMAAALLVLCPLQSIERLTAFATCLARFARLDRLGLCRLRGNRIPTVSVTCAP